MARFQRRSRSTSPGFVHLMTLACVALTLSVAGCSSDDGTGDGPPTGSTEKVRSEMRGMILVGTANVGNVTPITHAVFINGAYRIQPGASQSAAFAGAIADMTAALGFDPTTVVPVAPSTSPTTSASMSIDIYNAILAGFSELLDSNPDLSPTFDNAETWDIVKAVAEDLTDGRLDADDIAGNGILVDPDGDGVTIPTIDLSTFGAPTVNPGDEWDVSGFLAVTGTDAALLAPSGIFSPNFVDVIVTSPPGEVRFNFTNVSMGTEGIGGPTTILLNGALTDTPR